MKFGYQGAFHRDDDNLFPTISNDHLMQILSHAVQQRRAEPADRTASRSGPARSHERCAREYYAFFAQEQWTKDRLTLQGALRFDRAWSSFPEQQIGPSVTGPDRDRAAGAGRHHGLQRHQSANRRRLRPVRQRQDVAQGQRRAIPAPGVEPGPLHQRQPVGTGIDDHRPGPGPTPTATTRRTATAERPAAKPGDDRIDRHVRRLRRSEFRTSTAGHEARRFDSRRLGSAAVRLAVRRVGPAGADAESLGRSRILPPVVADLRRRRHHRQHQYHARPITRSSASIAPSDPRLPNGGGYAVRTSTTSPRRRR